MPAWKRYNKSFCRLLTGANANESDDTLDWCLSKISSTQKSQAETLCKQNAVCRPDGFHTERCVHLAVAAIQTASSI